VALSPEQRRLRARVAALTRWSREDSVAGTEKARDGFLQAFLNEVDPDRSLPEPERLRRAVAARKAHMASLALKSSKARSRRAAS
jgi:hypothetical protein